MLPDDLNIVATTDKESVFQGLRALLQPPLSGENFEDIFEKLLLAARVQNISDYAATLYMSWILWRSLWQSATTGKFVDTITGDEWDDQRDVPPAIASDTGRVRYMQRRTWTSKAQFIRSMANILNRNTFWARHSQIKREIELYMIANDTDDIPEREFRKIVKDVVEFRTMGSSVFDAIFETHFERKHGASPEIVGTNDYVIQQLGHDGKLPEETDERIRAAAKIARDLIREGRELHKDGLSKTDAIKYIEEKTLVEVEYEFRDGWVYVKHNQLGENNTILSTEYRIVLQRVDGSVLTLEEIPYAVMDDLMRLKLRLKNQVLEYIEQREMESGIHQSHSSK